MYVQFNDIVAARDIFWMIVASGRVTRMAKLNKGLFISQ